MKFHFLSPGDSNTDTHIPEGRVYEFPGDRLCPVAAYEMYLEKLHPGLEALWQRRAIATIGKMAHYGTLPNLWESNIWAPC